jgi:hypothetical protein
VDDEVETKPANRREKKKKQVLAAKTQKLKTAILKKTTCVPRAGCMCYDCMFYDPHRMATMPMMWTCLCDHSSPTVEGFERSSTSTEAGECCAASRDVRRQPEVFKAQQTWR